MNKNIYLKVLCLSLLAPVLKAENCNNFFVTLGTGGSFSTKSNMCVDNRYWDPAPEGYKSSLGNSELYTVGLGYKFSPLFAATVETGIRPMFKYKKFQSAAPGSQVANLGAKNRIFRLSNTSLMANAYFYGEGINECLAFKMDDCLSLQPFFGLGIGLSYNTMYDFHSVLQNVTINSNGLLLNEVANVMTHFTKRALAAQATVGLEFLYRENFALNFGYRYFYGGKIKSNNYVTSSTTPESQIESKAYTVPTWTGKLQSNEFFINFQVFLEI